MSVCATCRRALLSSRLPPSTRILYRSVATVPATPNAAPSTPPPATTSKTTTSTPATSSSPHTASQPFSNPEHSPVNTLKAAEADVNSTPAAAGPGVRKLASKLPGGVDLTSLSFLKGVEPIKTMEDDEYPAWLWRLLEDPAVGSIKAATEGGLNKTALAEMTKKQRAKYERKQERLRLSLPQKVPLHEQSIDLTPRDATAQQSLAKRQELTKSQREARRKSIRESNFLKSM